MLTTLADRFGVRAGEGRLLSLFLVQYFFLGVASAFTQAYAYALFLDAFGSQALPFAYIATAVLASTSAYAYLKLSERSRVQPLLTGNLIALAAVSFAIWAALGSSAARIVMFVLPAWFQILANMSNLALWSLAGRLYDVRQGKRLFGLIGAGNWGATAAGGLLVAPFVAAIGTTNLALVSAIAIALAIVFQRIIMREHARELHPAPSQQAKPSRAARGSGESLLRNRYVVLILGMVVLFWIAFFFIDNIFFDRATARYPDSAELARAIGTLIAVTGILGLATSLFLSGPILARFGLRGGLITMPAMLTASIGALAVVGAVDAQAAILFWFAAFAKLVSVAFGFSLQQASFGVVYQPLPTGLSMRARTLADGVVQPLAVGSAGLLLFAFTAFLGMNAVGLSWLYLIIAALWMTLIVGITRAYPAMLARAIARRRFGETPMSLVESSSVDALRTALSSPGPAASLYALNQLQQSELLSLSAVFPTLMDHPSPLVRSDALQRVETQKAASALPLVARAMADDPSPEVRESAILAFAALSPDEARSKLGAIASAAADVHVRRGALAGLWRAEGAEGEAAAQVRRLAESPAVADRVLAAQVLSAVPSAPSELLESLLADAEVTVRRQAVIAAASRGTDAMWSRLITLLDDRPVAATAEAALAGRPQSEAAMIAAFSRGSTLSTAGTIRLARALGRSGSAEALGALAADLDQPDLAIRSQILRSLTLSRITISGAEGARVGRQLDTEVEECGQLLRAAAATADDEFELLHAALLEEIEQGRERMFALLSLIHVPQRIQHARDALKDPSGAQHAFALEVLDTELSRREKEHVWLWLEPMSLRDRLARLGDSHAAGRDRTAWVAALAGDTPPVRVSAWTRVCAVAAAGMQADKRFAGELEAASISADPLLRETARAAIRGGAPTESGEVPMFTTIEKVLVLKDTDIFSRTPDAVLADVAQLLEEVEVDKETAIIAKGDAGDSLYIVVDGRVQVRDGERVIAELGSGKVFGEMALLDPEPRVASVFALEPTRLLRLSRDPFAELVSERGEVALGIIHMLTGRLRERMKDIEHLDARLKAAAEPI